MSYFQNTWRRPTESELSWARATGWSWRSLGPCRGHESRCWENQWRKHEENCSQKVVRRMGRVKTRGILQQAIYYIPRAKAGPRTGVAAQSLGCDAVEEVGTCLGSPCGAGHVEGTWLPPLPTSYCSAAGSRWTGGVPRMSSSWSLMWQVFLKPFTSVVCQSITSGLGKCLEKKELTSFSTLFGSRSAQENCFTHVLFYHNILIPSPTRDQLRNLSF